MKIGEFSFYEAPQEPYLDSTGKRYFAQLKPKGVFTLETLFSYVTTSKEAKRTTEQFRTLLHSTQAGETVPRFKTTKTEGGTWEFTPEGETTKAKAFKNRKFRVITATGVFGYKRAKEFKTASNLVCVDFDHFCTSEDEVRKAKEGLLREDLLCTPVLIFTSPSGDGLKCLYKFEHTADEAERLARLKGLYKYLQEQFPAWKDLSKQDKEGNFPHALDGVVDLARGCNVPFDPEARLNLDGRTNLDWSVWREEQKPYTPNNYTPDGDLEAKAQYYADALVQRGIDITDGMTFGEYLGLAFSLKTLTHGRDIFLQVSSLWSNYTENNSLKIWSYTDKQAPNTDITYFISLARKAGVPSWESSTEEGREQARAYMKQQEINKPQGAKEAPQGANSNDMEKDTAKDKSPKISGILTLEELEEIVFKKYGFEDLMKEAGNIPPSLETKYSFGGHKLTLKASALTIIGAQTSHGKTRFLENLLLDVCDLEEDGVTLFFTLEEPLQDVLAELVNIRTNKKNLCPNYQSNFDTLQAFFRREATQDPEQFKGTVELTRNGLPDGKADLYPVVRKSVCDFYRKYIEGGRNLLFYDDERLKEIEVLFRACKKIAEKHKVKAVFVDHVGMLYEKDASPSMMKTERVERIFTRLEELAKELSCPLVLSQQLNRPSEGALSLNNTNLSDSADSERSANTIVLLWNSTDIPTKTKEADVDSVSTPKPLLELGFEYGTPGTIFARLSKRRGGAGKNSFNVFKFEGDTGVIEEMTTEEIRTKQEDFKKYNKNVLHPEGNTDTDASKTPNKGKPEQQYKTQEERKPLHTKEGDLPFKAPEAGAKPPF